MNTFKKTLMLRQRSQSAQESTSWDCSGSKPQAELTQESDLAAGAIRVRCWGHNETLGQLNL